MTLNGTIIGYDPGGNSSHGVAKFTFRNGNLIHHSVITLKTAFEVIKYVGEIEDLIALGVDTLTCWSTGESGWRPADRWLRNKYKVIGNSIASANSLFGSMGLNGMSVLISLRKKLPNLLISETHPKVLYYALSQQKYDYKDNHPSMDAYLSALFDEIVDTNNDHEWDAAISVYAVMKGFVDQWHIDLHQLPTRNDESIIMPCGETKYWWPEELSDSAAPNKQL